MITGPNYVVTCTRIKKIHTHTALVVRPHTCPTVCREENQAHGRDERGGYRKGKVVGGDRNPPNYDRGVTVDAKAGLASTANQSHRCKTQRRNEHVES